MTTSPFDALQRYADLLNTPHPVALRAGTAIIDWIRALPSPGASVPAVSAALLCGLQVYPDPDLDDGQWKALDQNGDEVGAGRIGNPGDHVFYLHGGGFICVDPVVFGRGMS